MCFCDDLPALILPLVQSPCRQTMPSIRFYLIFFSAVGLLPITLSYGINPNQILTKLLQVQPVEPGVVHVFRAIMGLYLASIVLWLLGAIRG
jgi:hypothetical protein